MVTEVDRSKLHGLVIAYASLERALEQVRAAESIPSLHRLCASRTANDVRTSAENWQRIAKEV